MTVTIVGLLPPSLSPPLLALMGTLSSLGGSPASFSAWARLYLLEEELEETEEEKEEKEEPKLPALDLLEERKSLTLDLPFEALSLEQQVALLLLHAHSHLQTHM